MVDTRSSLSHNWLDVLREQRLNDPVDEIIRYLIKSTPKSGGQQLLLYVPLNSPHDHLQAMATQLTPCMQ
jgi:hypothetical protein